MISDSISPAPEAVVLPREQVLTRIAELADEAGIQNIHVLAWRDLDDVEAGGSEVHAANVCRLWAEAGLDVRVRTSFAQGHPPTVVRDGYQVVRRAGRYLVFPRAAFGEWSGRAGPHDALVEIWNGMPFFSPLWDFGPKLVFLHHVHAEMWSMVLPPNLARLGDTVERRIAPWIYRNSRVVTLSESSKREMVENLAFRGDRVSVVPPGIDERFSPGGERAPHPLVVAFGRLVPVKRYDLLIDQAMRARERVPDLELVIAGDGYERLALKERIDAHGAASWVRLAGWVSEDEQLDLYRRAWLLTSASLREGWGMSITEAAACGTPAVVSDIAGHRDALADGVTGLLVGADELGGALAELLVDHERRRKMGRAALDHSRHYGWPVTALRLMALLAEDATRRRRRGGLRR